MAGEAVLLLTPRRAVSIDWVATKRVSMGDVEVVGDCVAFAMSGAKKGETVAMCIEADLVDAPKKENQTLEAGQLLRFERGKSAVSGDVSVQQRGRGDMLCGYVHDAAREADTRVRMVWRNYT